MLFMAKDSMQKRQWYEIVKGTVTRVQDGLGSLNVFNISANLLAALKTPKKFKSLNFLKINEIFNLKLRQ